jgi:hypothetical protein
VHAGDRLAEPVRLGGEVAAHLVGAQVGLGEQVAGAGLGHRPALGGVLRVLGDHAQRQWLAVGVGALDRAEQPGHVRAAGPAEDPVQLQVRVDPGHDPAEHLEDGGRVEHDAGVGLLGVADPGRRVERQGGLGFGHEPQRPGGGAAGDQAQQVPGGGLVVQGVVSGALAVGADGGDAGELRGRRLIPADEDLVPL